MPSPGGSKHRIIATAGRKTRTLIASIPVAAYYARAVYLGTHYLPYHVAGGGNWVISLPRSTS